MLFALYYINTNSYDTPFQLACLELCIRVIKGKILPGLPYLKYVVVAESEIRIRTSRKNKNHTILPAKGIKRQT
jgi:hypothetical protein